MERVLVVDCEPGAQAQVRERLLQQGHEALERDDGESAVITLQSGERVLVMRRASAMNSEEIALLVRRALQSLDSPLASYSTPTPDPRPSPLIGDSEGIRGVRQAISRLRSKPTLPVLITGESGVGKTTAARALHAETAAGGNFYHLPPLSGSDASLEALGILRRAEGGTLFLGEIADVPLSVQAQLLRLLQTNSEPPLAPKPERSVQTRIVATSTQSLDAAVRNGRVRPELAYRLAVLTLQIPPLRERRQDIPLFVNHFVQSLSTHSPGRSRGVTDAVMQKLLVYSWPGNVRELRNALESAALLSDGDYLNDIRLCHEPQPVYRLPSEGIDFRKLEREVLVQALKLAAGNQTRAAVLLKLTRDQIRYRIAKFGMNGRDGPDRMDGELTEAPAEH